MTEAEWLVCEDTAAMLAHLTGATSDRKRRLFSCGCCRRFWSFLADEGSRPAIEVAEQFADGNVDLSVLLEVHSAARKAYERVYYHGPAESDYTISQAVKHLTETTADPAYLVVNSVFWHYHKMNSVGSGLLRDVFGNPFRLPTIESAWRTPLVVALAHAAYEMPTLPSGEIDRDRLLVLSDALEEVGCTDVAILSHLRSPGPHVRGCWALDLILGKQ
jgi:hypothetical protein